MQHRKLYAALSGLVLAGSLGAVGMQAGNATEAARAAPRHGPPRRDAQLAQRLRRDRATPT